MSHPAVRPIDKAHLAINAYRASTDLDDAEDSWCDFLHHWVRAVNRYDAHGRQTVGKSWRPLRLALRSDDRLTYLWEARNTDEHSISPVAGRTPAVALVNPIAIEVGDELVVGLGGEPGIDLGAGLSLTFSPGNLHLVPIHDRSGKVYSPPIHDGWMMNPQALMEYGLAFLNKVILP